MFSETIKTRFSDTDALGHINNTKVPIWFEGARDPIFKWFMPTLETQQWQLILAKIDVCYHGQIYYGENIVIKTFISRIGNASFDVYQELWQHNIKCASGTAAMVHYCFKKKSSLKISDNVKQQMQQHLISEKNEDKRH